MHKIHAEHLVHAMEYFGRLSIILVHQSNEGDVAGEDVKENFLGYVEKIEPFLQGFRVPATLAALRNLSPLCKKDSVTERDLGHAAEQVIDRFSAELGDQWLLILEHEHSRYLDDDVAPMGSEVRDKFPSFADDIDESAKCLALSRYTASVFHLMRVMESSVHTLAKKMSIKIDVHSSSWNDITNHISSALNAMPGKDPRQKKRKAAHC